MVERAGRMLSSLLGCLGVAVVYVALVAQQGQVAYADEPAAEEPVVVCEASESNAATANNTTEEACVAATCKYDDCSNNCRYKTVVGKDGKSTYTTEGTCDKDATKCADCSCGYKIESVAGGVSVSSICKSTA